MPCLHQSKIWNKMPLENSSSDTSVASPLLTTKLHLTISLLCSLIALYVQLWSHNYLHYPVVFDLLVSKNKEQT